MEVQDIKELMSQFDASSLMEMSLKIEEVDVTFSKRVDQPQVAAHTNFASPVVATSAETNHSNLEENTESNQLQTTVANERTDVEYVVSPIVGIVYVAPSPEDDPYVQVGDTVTKGQTVCIVEAMKLMNEIQSEHTGKVVEILVQNGQMVDFNQPLFAISK